MLQTPIFKRFSSGKTPRKSISFADENGGESEKDKDKSSKQKQRHSRKSVLNNLDDFLTDSFKTSDREIFDRETIAFRKKVDRDNLYDYLQYYMRMDLDDIPDNDAENNLGINEDEEKENLLKELNDIPALYKQKFKAGLMKECAFLQVAKMNEIEKLKVDYKLYPDSLPFLWLRRNAFLFCKYWKFSL